LLIPRRDLLEKALSKNSALSIVTQAGVGAPKTLVPENESEIVSFAHEVGTPLVIKGETGQSGENVRIVWDANDAVTKYREVAAREMRPGRRPALQEFVRGPAYSVGGLFINGKPLRVIVHRKLIRYPYPHGGMSVKGVTERCPEVLRESFKAFEAFEYTGLGHVEFIRDVRDGSFKFLEINARPWGTIGVAQRAGVDLFSPYGQLVNGLPVEADLRYRDGMPFHRIAREIRLIRERPQRIFGFLKDCLDPRVHSDFIWTDPGPHFVGLVDRVRSARQRSSTDTRNLKQRFPV
jgi:D-aspartate ligase